MKQKSQRCEVKASRNPLGVIAWLGAGVASRLLHLASMYLLVALWVLWAVPAANNYDTNRLIKPTVEQLNVPIVPVQLPDLQNISESLNDDATNHTVDLLVQQQQQQATVAAAPKLPPDKEAPKEKQPSAATVSEEPKPANQSEEIPSFNEWAQKQLAEAEKKKVQNTSELPKAAPKAQGNIKIRSKNYASPDCGAKIVGANQEAQHASSVLSSSQDEYALSPCNSAKIWFVVELCEAIQPKQIELANYELFSSSPQEFSVFFSDRYPTRDWHLVGQFTAQDERTVQSFNLEPFPSFGKFIKVEMHSHYGKEHFCPVSLFRAYGTSEFEVLETEEEGHSARHAEEDDIDDDVAGSIQPEKVQPKNLFGSATEAVISIVKKAAQAANVFAKTGDSSNSTSSVTDMLLTNNTMCSMSPNIPFEELCPNCTPGVLNLLTCNYRALRAMLSSNYVLKALQREQLCFRTSFNESFLGVMLGPDYISALCRILLSLHPAPINMSLAEDANSDFVLVVKPSGQPSGVSTCSKVSGSSADISSGEKESSLDSSVPIQPTQTLKQKKDSEEVQIESVVAPTASVHLDIVPVEQAPQENLIEEVAAPEDETDQNVTEEWPASENGEVVDLLPEDEGSDVVELTSQSSQQTHQTSSSTTTTNAAPATPSSATPNPVNVHMQGGQQKESAFVRLANRIKALERNMSLSAQYLEELSKRYKKQVDEMQKAYDRTLAAVSESSRQAAQREQIQAEKFNSLEQRFLILAETAAILLAEKDSWQYKFQAICHNVILVSAAVYLILHLIKKIGVRTVKESTPDLDRRLSVFKRHLSADDIPNDEPIRKRRTSELETEVCPSPKLKVPEKKLVLPLALKHDPLADKENRLDPYKKKRKRLRRELRGMSVQDLCSGLSPGTLAIMRAPTLKVAPKPSISPIHRLTPIKGRRHSTDNSIIDNEFWKKEFKMSLSHSDKIAVFTNGEEGKEGSTLTVELIKADEDENTPPAAQTVQQPKKSSSGLKKMVKKLF
ncbi:SUN domain-containing ossification factor isoform X2 [Neocloeon triangulifer]|uniref:SUN domain-containing ossification factor isoform X2 n=1 Tax=Neocloeon triangulifer TaxID=2078957 RepID=UPI00286F026B|nr:SUN domain-containing ossification factor isoform X2 [Neocloeon triangulifer]XP_059473250.1 SUN domain-containing ossification factor isoform X2 [Neocloeon triangulifer]XP_059473251.1 SUN domain-containing ossification factor isoform X2 [Neocloeon triangulifer]